MRRHGFLIDMDGVIYRGKQLIPGADQFIASLLDRGVPFAFLTNNSQRTRRDVATKLARMGIPVDESHIFTCAMATARFVSTPATVFRYATVPRLSSMGFAAALAASPARWSARSSRRDPISARAASGTRSAVGATAPMAMRAAVQVPPASSVTLAPAPATAMSISVRGMSRR